MPLITRAVADSNSESSLPVDIRHCLCTVTPVSPEPQTDTNSKSKVYHHFSCGTKLGSTT
ncbi:hypothetical protein BU25DRAFT_270219 [Macroventuria anomochaeta]|uniref:Uncharacterized protein n=1 Tax=Macroventuria anomochaeta TaxID=301207 RepID=A0ACB6S8R5_9PLEO|nr:uncharacterized protein BU25DRAFT_270219 [Macroventuria anomochaeta]KAF2629604.1 hypothetical protein BU25DRAFT_270219 [Macroventuria anomochaeta]